MNYKYLLEGKSTTWILFQKITFFVCKATHTLGFSLNSSKLIKDYLFLMLIFIIQVLDFFIINELGFSSNNYMSLVQVIIGLSSFQSDFNFFGLCSILIKGYTTLTL
jgi:hypothetical protein